MRPARFVVVVPGHCLTWRCSSPQLQITASRLALGCVGLRRQLLQELKELLRLTDEESIAGQPVERSRGRPHSGRRPNDGDSGELPVEERCRFGHDQVCLKVLAAERRSVKVREAHLYASHWVSVADVGSIARFVVPGLEVRDLRAADAEKNPQDLHIGDALRQRRIETAAALLDEGEVEAGRIGDGLGERAVQVPVGAGNRRMLSHRKAGHGLLERVSQVRVPRAAAIASPPRGVHGELHEIGETANLVGAVALLLGKVRNWSRLTVSAPLEARYALMKVSWLSSSSVLS